MPSSVVEGHLEYIESWHKFKTTEDNTILQDWLAKSNKVRNMVANLIKVNSNEIAFTMNTGAGLNIVVNGIDWKKGDNVVFPEWEHNPLYTHTTVKNGVESRAVKVENGVVNISHLDDAIDDNTRLVQVSQVSYTNGFRFDLKEIVEIAHEHEAMVLVDATQAVGAIDVDYHKEKVDFVSIAPYKYLMGPTGLAFLYLAEEKIPELVPDRTGWKNQIWEGDSPEELPDLNSAEKFEYGTLNFEGMYALERSLKFLNEIRLKKIEKRVLSLSNYLYEQIMEQDKEMYTQYPPESPIVSYFQKKSAKFAQELRYKKVKITGREAHGGHIRVSVHFYNTKDEIDRFIDEIK
jgi:selenocysteine lyase/cysteine desulfurase